MILFVLALLLAGCGGSSPATPSGPDDPVTWRGARVVGVSPSEAAPILERAWVRAQRTYGPSDDPVGWTMELSREPIPCPWNNPIGCGGILDIPGRPVPTWGGHRAGLEAVAYHEWCHVIRYLTTGDPFGSGCLTLTPR